MPTYQHHFAQDETRTAHAMYEAMPDRIEGSFMPDLPEQVFVSARLLRLTVGIGIFQVLAAVAVALWRHR